MAEGSSSGQRPLCLRLISSFFSLVFVISLAVLGGVLNHMRGSDGGMLTGKAFADYWGDHIYTRLLMAVPTGSLIYLCTQRPFRSLLLTAAMFASIFIGWGCYFGMGWSPSVNARDGFLDWAVGREQEGWEHSRRWVRDYAGMGFRGLLWTFPTGYFLRHCGYSWQFALSGALMPAFYTLGMYPSEPWTYNGWQPKQCSDPPFQADWAFSAGAPRSEFLWGFWLWFSLLVCLHRIPLQYSFHHAIRFGSRNVDLTWRLSEILSFLLLLVFAISTVFYAFVKQADHRNWAQTLAGLAVCTVFQLITQIQALRARRGRSNRSKGTSYAVSDDYHDGSVQQGLLPVDDELLMSESFPPLDALFRGVDAVLLMLASCNLLVVIGCFVASIGWNADTARYCHGSECP